MALRERWNWISEYYCGGREGGITRYWQRVPSLRWTKFNKTTAATIADATSSAAIVYNCNNFGFPLGYTLLHRAFNKNQTVSCHTTRIRQLLSTIQQLSSRKLRYVLKQLKSVDDLVVLRVRGYYKLSFLFILWSSAIVFLLCVSQKPDTRLKILLADSGGQLN